MINDNMETIGNKTRTNQNKPSTSFRNIKNCATVTKKTNTKQYKKGLSQQKLRFYKETYIRTTIA